MEKNKKYISIIFTDKSGQDPDVIQNLLITIQNFDLVMKSFFLSDEFVYFMPYHFIGEAIEAQRN